MWLEFTLSLELFVPSLTFSKKQANFPVLYFLSLSYITLISFVTNLIS